MNWADVERKFRDWVTDGREISVALDDPDGGNKNCPYHNVKVAFLKAQRALNDGSKNPEIQSDHHAARILLREAFAGEHGVIATQDDWDQRPYPVDLNWKREVIETTLSELREILEHNDEFLDKLVEYHDRIAIRDGHGPPKGELLRMAFRHYDDFEPDYGG